MTEHRSTQLAASNYEAGTVFFQRLEVLGFGCPVQCSNDPFEGRVNFVGILRWGCHSASRESIV